MYLIDDHGVRLEPFSSPSFKVEIQKCPAAAYVVAVLCVQLDYVPTRRGETIATMHIGYPG